MTNPLKLLLLALFLLAPALQPEAAHAQFSKLLKERAKQHAADKVIDKVIEKKDRPSTKPSTRPRKP